MNRRQKIIVSVTGIFIVLLILIGLTYAYFLTRITGNGNPTSISVTTANLELVYGDGSTAILTSETPLLPSSTPIGTKDFTVTNRGDDTDYVVVFEDIITKYAADTVVDGQTVAAGTPTTFLSNDFVYTLDCTKKDGTSCNGVENKMFPINGGVAVGNDIVKGDVHTYVLTLYYLDNGYDQSNDMNKTLNGKVNIKDMRSVNPYNDNKQSLAFNLINSAVLQTNGTFVSDEPLTRVGLDITTKEGVSVVDKGKITMIGDENNYHQAVIHYSDDYRLDKNASFTYFVVEDNMKTMVINTADNSKSSMPHENLIGKYVRFSIHPVYGDSMAGRTFESRNIYKITKVEGNTFYYDILSPVTPTESIMAATEDDYGTTYFYRGNIQDNYVEFADMCWRVMRIEGDGSIKMVLASKKSCSSYEFHSEDYSSNITNVNYGYTNSNGTDYADYFTPTAENSMKSAFDKFYTDYLTTYDNKIKQDTIWCTGKTDKLYSKSTPAVLITDKSAEELISSKTRFYYEKRLALDPTEYTQEQGEGTVSPTLLCKNTDNEYHSYKIGTFTADEIVYAGGAKDKNNQLYYLGENTLSNVYTLTEVGFYTGTPSYFGTFTTTVTNTLATGSVNSSYPINARPVISLIPKINITSGTGTRIDPYKVG